MTATISQAKMKLCRHCGRPFKIYNTGQKYPSKQQCCERLSCKRSRWRRAAAQRRLSVKERRKSTTQGRNPIEGIVVKKSTEELLGIDVRPKLQRLSPEQFERAVNDLISARHRIARL